MIHWRGHLNITGTITIDGGALTLCAEGTALAKCSGSLFSPLQKCEGAAPASPGTPTFANGGSIDTTEFDGGSQPYHCSDPNYVYWPGWP